MAIRNLLIGLCVIFSSCASPGARQQQAEDHAPAASPAPSASIGEWPRRFTDEDRQITLYQPQVEKRADHRLVEHAAVSVMTPASSEPVYGLVKITARTRMDPKSRLVTFEDVQVTEASFPTAAELNTPALSVLRQNASSLLKPIAQDRLRTDLTIARAEAARKPPVLRNTPPQILFSTSPAVLVPIDGSPTLRKAGNTDLLRVVNTRALMILDPSSGKHYFYMGDRWMESAAIEGPWSVAVDPPPALEQAKQAALDLKQVDLLNDSKSPLMRALKQGITPKVYVGTKPTELLQTQGAPSLQSISNTRLLYVENTSDNIFVNETDQNYYVLVSGRWYRARSLSGPWTYVSPKKLPADFAKIPEGHRKSAVLASVAGTPQAREASIGNEVPQTARVNRTQANLSVEYDGTPRFEAIKDTPMRYAVNSAVPVIEVSPRSYYAVRAGVWFVASAPDGPWAVASRVPAVIYSIPPSSPLYYVTYVRVYDATPDSVDMGYTAGYIGSYCCNDGVVVFGTGYYYPPWVGTYWIGTPVTFGIGFGLGYGFYPWWSPWWGYGILPYYPYIASAPVIINQTNIYQGWSSQAVTSTNASAFNNAYVASNNQSSSEWRASEPSTPPAPWGASTHDEAARIGAFNGTPPAVSAPTPGNWGAFQGGAPAVPAPGGGGGGAQPGGAQPMAHAFSGGGWGAKK